MRFFHTTVRPPATEAKNNSIFFGTKSCRIEKSVLSLHSQNETGAVVQLVRIHACHAWGRGFESRPHRAKAPRSIKVSALLCFPLPGSLERGAGNVLRKKKSNAVPFPAYTDTTLNPRELYEFFASPVGYIIKSSYFCTKAGLYEILLLNNRNLTP